MGVPKLKWTSEEEAALRAGIMKYGLSKWRKIRGDLEFAKVLEKRSNVNLKDKWRNMSLITSGGCRNRARPKQSEMQTIYERGNFSSPRKERDLKDCMLDSRAVLSEPENLSSPRKEPYLKDCMLDSPAILAEPENLSSPRKERYLKDCMLDSPAILAEPENLSSPRKERYLKDCMLDSPAILSAASQIGSSKTPIPRLDLDILILDAIVDLMEKGGSSRAAIFEYLQEKHSVPPNALKLLNAELKSLTNCGKLIKAKNRYRIGPSSSCLGPKRETSAIKVLHVWVQKEENDAELEKMLSRTPQQAPAIAMEVVAEADTTSKVLTKAGIDAELEKMRSMTPQQAAAMAMKALAEAEAAILEAERAEKAAEVAEADAKRAKVFADTAMGGFKAAYPFHMTMATR